MSGISQTDDPAGRGFGLDARMADAAWLVGAGAVLLLQAALILGHEHFVDEWQALQIAVQSPDLVALLANLHYEGHPPLWHLVLRCLSALVGPHHALPVASLLFGLATQCLILFRSPFPRWARLAIALSEPILFEYGTVSRSYTLGVMLTFAALAAWDRKRLVWLPLALLPTVEFFFGLISAALILARFGEKRIWRPGLACWVVLGLAAAWTVIPAADFVSAYDVAQDPLRRAVIWLLNLSVLAFPFQWDHGPHWNSPAPLPMFLTLWLPFLYLCFDQTRGRLPDRMSLLVFMLVFFIFFVFFYNLGIRQLMLVSVLLVALQWRHSARGEGLRWPFKIWILLGAGCGLATAAVNFAMPFNRDSRALAVIRERGLEGEHWVSVPAQHGQGISAMSGILFEGPENGCMSDFVRWNFARTVRSSPQLTRWTETALQQDGRFYLLSEVPLETGADAVLLAHIPGGYDGAQYYLYEVGPGHVEERGARPRCVPGMRPMPPAAR